MKYFLFLIMLVPTYILAQQRTSGVYNSPVGFSKVNWSFTYEVEMAEAARSDLKGPLFVSFSDQHMTVAGSTFNSQGKNYSPAQAGMSSWPEVNMEYAAFQCDADVYYRGSLVKQYKTISVKNRSVLIGRFDSHKGTPPNDRQGIYLGGNHINSTDFNLSDMKIEISNVSPGGFNTGTDRIIASILKKQESDPKAPTPSTRTVTIGNPSSGSSSGSQKRPSPPATGGTDGNSSAAASSNTSTWEQTNARIQAENQRAYDAQRQQIAETQRRNKELGDQLVSGTAEIVGMVGNMIQQNRADKEKKEAYRESVRRDIARAEAEKAAEAAAEKRKLKQRQELRTGFFLAFPPATIPLSSKPMAHDVLYYFTYVFDDDKMENIYPTMDVSKVFVISKYADGTWPYVNAVTKEIRAIKSEGTIRLVGWFVTKEEAEAMRKKFLSMALQSDFSAEDFVYKGKVNDASSDTKFWEDDTPGKTVGAAGSAVIRVANGDEDFWQTGQFKKAAIKQADAIKEKQARSNYTDALAAFNGEDYKGALKYLESAESRVTGWSPKVSGLKIKALDKIADYNNFKDPYSLLLDKEVKIYDAKAASFSQLDEETDSEVKAIIQKEKLQQSVYSFSQSAEYKDGLIAYNNKDYKTAIDEWKIGAAKKNWLAAAELAKMHYSGEAVQRDYTEALNRNKPAVEAGYAPALLMTGKQYYYGYGVDVNYEQAAELLLKAAEKGEADAMYFVAVMYKSGNGLTQSNSQALEWFNKAAGAGSVSAMVWLGGMYYAGNAAVRDYKKAFCHFSKAAEAGNDDAQACLGFMYENGLHVSRDYKKAFDYYNLAIAQKNTTGMVAMGKLYLNGYGVKKDAGEAISWFEKSVAAGETEPMQWIAQMYAEGRGVRKDKKLATEWQSRYDKAKK